ncbi:MAG: HAMP domain-containing sensor histidine kinase [Cyanobacteria bacterium P01_F01_bin.56]
MNSNHLVQIPRAKQRSFRTPQRFLSRRPLEATRCLDENISDSITPENLDQLFEQLPIEGIWIRTHGPTPENNQTFFHAKEPHYFSSEIIDYLTSEQWLTSNILPFQVCPISLAIPSYETSYLYMCAYNSAALASYLSSSGTNLSGYWLVWTPQPLTAMQKYCIEQPVRCLQEQQTRLLSQAHLSREVQLLRQALYQTEHQLRTPLSLVELYADLLYQSLAGNPLQETADYICKTVNEIDVSLKRLTRQKEVSQTERRKYNMRHLIAECIEAFQVYLDQKSLVFVSDGEPISVWVDPWQLQQVFKNLLNNAIAFSPLNGTITCKWEASPTEVLIKIADQGPGFSSEDLAHLFTPFYSRRPCGTGLGLAIARDIIDAHQGRLQATNQPSGGALISIVLPRFRSDRD